MKPATYAAQLIQKFGTNNPYTIASQMEVHVRSDYLEPINVRGYFTMLEGLPVITVANHLSPIVSRFVCAHELGHYLLHGKLNRIFMDKHTCMVIDKYENAADAFAYALTFPADNAYFDTEQITVWDMSDCLNIPAYQVEERLVQLIEYT